MTEPNELLEQLGKPFPPHAIERRQGGGNQMFDYVATETVIRRLNATAGTWDFRLTEIKVIESLLVVWGELTIPGLGTRAGTGVQKLQGGEDMWKGAASDCLKKCATLFNVGIDLYGPDLEAGELPNVPTRTQTPLPARTRTTSQNTAPQPNPDNHMPPGWTDLWNFARSNGFKGKPDLEAAIGHLGSDPAYAMERLQAHLKDRVQQPLASLA